MVNGGGPASCCGAVGIGVGASAWASLAAGMMTTGAGSAVSKSSTGGGISSQSGVGAGIASNALLGGAGGRAAGLAGGGTGEYGTALRGCGCGCAWDVVVREGSVEAGATTID